jgi:hypothetical protein
MNRFAVIAALFFACSPVKGTPLIDAEIIEVQSLAISPSSVPQLRVGLDAPVQLSVQATFSDGTKKDVTPYAKWSSSDPSITVDATGLATAVSAGSATITAALDSSSATLSLSTRSAILIVTDISNDTGVSSVDFFDASVTGSDVTPIRSIQGSNAALLSEPFSAFPDGSNNEVFVTLRSTGINVYPLDGSGDIAPIRTIPVGATSTLLTEVVNAVLYKGELYVLAQTTGNIESVVVFDPTASGSSAAPLRSITGSATELLGGSYGLWVANDTIYVGQSTSGSNALLEFPSSGSGNIAPTMQMGGSALPADQVIGFWTSGDQLYVADDGLNHVSVVEDGAIIRQIQGPDTKFQNVTGIVQVGETLVCAEQGGQRIDMYPFEATGDAPPTASISGSASNISVPLQITAY